MNLFKRIFAGAVISLFLMSGFASTASAEIRVPSVKAAVQEADDCILILSGGGVVECCGNVCRQVT